MSEEIECLNCLDGQSIILKSGTYDWIKCGECGRRPDYEMSLEDRTKLQLNYLQSKLDCAVRALEWYANKENCNNPEGCFIYEVEEDAEEIGE